MGQPSVMAEGPGAREARRSQIVTWWARGHDELDKYGIPRLEPSAPDTPMREYTIAERIDMLAKKLRPS